MKTCIKCKLIKELTEFQLRSDSGKPRGECLSCRNHYKKLHRINNKEHIAGLKKKHHQANKEKDNARIRKWQQDNRDYVLNCKQQYFELNKDRYVESHLKKNYGITMDQYQEMAKKQNYICIICEQPETAMDNKRKTVRRLAVDHCHKTNKIRGLLCGNCNSGLGHMKDNISTLENAIKYLRLNNV